VPGLAGPPSAELSDLRVRVAELEATVAQLLAAVPPGQLKKA
jgi:hypothetical protein